MRPRCGKAGTRDRPLPPCRPPQANLQAPLRTGVLLAGVRCLLSVLWFAGLIFGAGYASRWLNGPRSVRVIDRITGTVLVGFGLKLALEPRH
ncbi:LysE family translocator [Pseudarthrobacter chlorophenolicus]|uniref:LysE family translocator n=1 Tax=Pseudarthrobacter chlorophenolicus TaxID=85085 RepID=UPI0009D6EDD8|nr:LysE family transporter [Pseudarthrobacter chlorophenolicus]